MIDEGETYAGTAARINRTFRTSFSRNAVISKLDRAANGPQRRKHNTSERAVIDWTPELLARAKALWEAHHSGEEIARTLGGNLTRGAVAAKAHRLGWQGGSPPGPKPRDGIARTTFRGSNQKTPVALRASKPLRPMPPAPPEARNLTIFDLTHQTCKWPVGEAGGAGQLFCGAVSEGAAGLPYCAWHARIAYAPVDARRSRQLAGLARAV